MSGLHMMIASGVLLAIVSACTGYTTGRNEVIKEWEAANLRAERDAQQARADAVQAVQARLAAETARGDALSQRLADTQHQLDQKQKELQREIARTTTGRTCFDARTVRLLNAAARRDAANSDAVPETAGAPDAAHAGVATDTDVARWAGDARIQYDTCRARLDALIEFEEGRQ